ncbi:MAG: ATP-binding cassette domain-containing protein [Trueperaceae bacterium]|nr:ATP-binding cassette domain-containing protein [Trueperaceae bacterium]
MSSQTLAKPKTSLEAIRLEGVCVEFEGNNVLKDVHLTINKGEFIALIGPSGGGKSTLLRVISGLLKAHSGKVTVSTKPAIVFQDYRLLPWRTVKENVNLPRELTGKGEGAENVLKQVGMLEHADRYPHQLSGGMQARVAIARALAQDSDVLLLDEPFSALDAQVRERFNLEMKRLHEKTHKTIIFVTHSIREAVYLADRVVVLKDGIIDTVLEAKNEGRITAYDDGIEAILRAKLGMGDSTFVKTHKPGLRFPWIVPTVVLLTTLLFFLWEWSARSSQSFFFPAPSQVWEALIDNASLLVKHTLASFRVAMLGILSSLLIGLPIGYLMGKKVTFERLLSPYIVALQAIPTIILTPLLIPWLGYGTLPRVLIATLISVFPVLVSTMVGVREVGRIYREVFSTIGANGLSTLFKLELPGALPVVLGGLRLTVTLALIGTIVAEFVLGSPGLGYFANSERLNFRFANAYAAVFINVVISLVLYLSVSLLEQWVLRYRKR